MYFRPTSAIPVLQGAIRQLSLSNSKGTQTYHRRSLYTPSKLPVRTPTKTTIPRPFSFTEDSSYKETYQRYYGSMTRTSSSRSLGSCSSPSRASSRATTPGDSTDNLNQSVSLHEKVMSNIL